MANIKSITGSCFGFGQISNDPHQYFCSLGGGIALCMISAGEPAAIIDTGGYKLYVYMAFGHFCIQIVIGTKGILPYETIDCDKMFLNTASPECLVEAAEEQLRLMQYTGKYQTLLESRRRAAGYTQKQLSELSGVHANIISRVEQGKQPIGKCTFDTICKLSAALQCRPENLVNMA